MKKEYKRLRIVLNVCCIFSLLCTLACIQCFFSQMHMSKITMDEQVKADFEQYETLFIDFHNQRKNGILPAHTVATIQGLAEINGYETGIERLIGPYSMLVIYNEDYYECLIVRPDKDQYIDTLIIDTRQEYFTLPICLIIATISSLMSFNIYYKLLIKLNKLKGCETYEL